MPLDLFKVPADQAVYVDIASLRETTQAVFEQMGVPSEDAALATDVMVMADMRGVDSHGVSNMLRSYVTGYQEGRHNPRPEWKVVRERASTATIDSDRGLGIIVAPKAMELAIEKAKQTGIGVVAIRNGGHMGMASYHAMLALEHDMIGVAMTAVGTAVVPTFGAVGRLGTNPIAVAAPAKKMHPFVLDIATSMVASNKLGLARRLSASLPAGMVADAEGAIVDTAGPLPEGYQNIPFGGTRELGSHKGYGMAMVVEILCTILSGGIPMTLPDAGRQATHHLAAYDIDAFTDVEQFKELMDQWLEYMEATPTAPGQERVLTPGLEEEEAEAQRRERGIPLHTEVVDWFEATCREFEIPFSLR
ncbi:MAG TPA: Ldh family oxidoreductase [Dehalococcoidia bacterium]|nr:Ldh family oxidoreductase [Dehalococcoidia bacterium]